MILRHAVQNQDDDHLKTLNASNSQNVEPITLHQDIFFENKSNNQTDLDILILILH